jgi:hypothetical protein
MANVKNLPKYTSTAHSKTVSKGDKKGIESSIAMEYNIQDRSFVSSTTDAINFEAAFQFSKSTEGNDGTGNLLMAYDASSRGTKGGQSPLVCNCLYWC